MAIFHNGKEIQNLYHNGVKVQSVYHNGIKIYSSGLPIGTILWSGSKAFTNQDYSTDGYDDETAFFYNNFLLNKKITLSNAISKCQNGIVVNFSKGAGIYFTGGRFYNNYSGHIKLPKSFSKGKIYEKSGTTVTLIKSNDSTVYFNSTFEGDNSTYIEWQDYNHTYLCIDSITAY